MDVLWSRTESTAEDVREALAKRHPMKDSTSRTILKRLEEKGYVKRHVEGRTNIYRVSEPPRHVVVFLDVAQLFVVGNVAPAEEATRAAPGRPLRPHRAAVEAKDRRISQFVLEPLVQLDHIGVRIARDRPVRPLRGSVGFEVRRAMADDQIAAASESLDERLHEFRLKGIASTGCANR